MQGPCRVASFRKPPPLPLYKDQGTRAAEPLGRQGRAPCAAVGKSARPGVLREPQHGPKGIGRPLF